ncbi:MAG: tetratricopeptide repeat protein, partial [Pseudomonadota bacterium]
KFFLGVSFLSAEEPAAALKWLESALELEPKREDIAAIYSYMGQCLKALGRYREAITILEKGETSDKERTDIYNLMGFCYFKEKEHEKAIECFRKVLQLDPASAIDYANIASNYRDMGDRDQAIRYYRFALELDPSIEFAGENLLKLQGK